MDVDQISDKHKISLFDDSRYEDQTLDARKTSLNQPLDEYSQSAVKKGKQHSRILKREGGDSLYDEQLLDKHLEEEKKNKAEDEVGFDFDEKQS